jgi:hypothetical protein
MFGNTDGRIFVYDKLNDDERSQSTRDTAVERDLYTAVSPHGELIDDIETKLLQPLECAAAPILKALVSRKVNIPNGSAKIIGTFIAFLSARVPRNIDVAREMGQIFIIEHQKLLARNPNKLKRLIDDYIADTDDQSMLSFDEMQKYLSDPEKYFKISLNRKVALGMSLMGVSVKMEVIPTLHWCVCRNHGGTPFITSDCPVVAFAPIGNQKVIFNAFWYSPKLEVSVPLSPNVCLYLCRKHQPPNRAVSEAFVKEINRRTAFTAERFVYSSIKAKYLRELVKWAQRRRPESWIDQGRSREAAIKLLERAKI